MGSDHEVGRFLATALGPVVLGGLAAFFFLALVAYDHLRSRALVDLLRRAVSLRERQEELKRRAGFAPHLPRFQRFEKGVRELLVREGLQAAAPKPTAPPGTR